MMTPETMVEVTLNGNPVMNGRAVSGMTHVEAKAFADAIGAQIQPGPDGKSVTLTKDARTFVASDQTDVPLRAMAMAFGGTVSYDPNLRSASVTLPPPSSSDSPAPDASASYAPDAMRSTQYAPDAMTEEMYAPDAQGASTSLYAPDAAAVYAPDAAAMYASDTFGGSRPQAISPTTGEPASPAFLSYLPWLLLAIALIAFAAIYLGRRSSGNVIAADRDRNR